MAVTGATFNFNKTVTNGETESAPDKPADGSKIETKTSGEKNGKENTKDNIASTIVSQSMKTAVNSAIANIEGSQMSEQVRALQTATTSVISNVVLAVTNPWMLIANLACKGIERAAKNAQYKREQAWEKYNLEEYRSAKGYTNSRSRK